MDKKDKSILFELTKNSRLSAQQISRKVSLSKDAVIYRIKRLKKQGIIKKFQTIIDLKKLNYRTHIIFLEFKKFNPKIEKSSISFLNNFPYTIWVSSSTGRWDIIIDVISKNAEHFGQILQKIINNLGENIKNYEILETIRESPYNHKYLYNKSKIEKIEKQITYKIDKIDSSIMNILSNNARLPSTEISKKLKISHDRITYRIKKLIKSGHIEQFTTLIDFQKLNLSYYYLLIQFNNLNKNKETEILNFLDKNNRVLFHSKNSGKYNFNIDLIVENNSQLREFLFTLRNLFGDIIDSKETLLIFEQHKNDYFPQGVFEI